MMKFKEGEQVRPSGNISRAGEVGTIDSQAKGSSDEEGTRERYNVRFPGDNLVYLYDADDLESAPETAES